MSGLWNVDDPALGPGESIVGRWYADRQEGGAPTRGRLVLTSQRLLFEPARMGWWLRLLSWIAGVFFRRGRRWSCALAEIVAVRGEPPVELRGERGARIRLELRSGGVEQMFVVTDVETAAATIRAATGGLES